MSASAESGLACRAVRQCGCRARDSARVYSDYRVTFSFFVLCNTLSNFKLHIIFIVDLFAHIHHHEALDIFIISWSYIDLHQILSDIYNVEIRWVCIWKENKYLSKTLVFIINVLLNKETLAQKYYRIISLQYNRVLWITVGTIRTQRR